MCCWKNTIDHGTLENSNALAHLAAYNVSAPIVDWLFYPLFEFQIVVA
jgi:hypothetical protein